MSLLQICLICQRPSTWWLEGASGTPQVGGSTPDLGLKKFHSPIPLKALGQGPANRHGQRAYELLCIGGQSSCSKAQRPAHGSFSPVMGPCMSGCGVRGVFSACVRRPLLNIKPWGRSFPYRSSFFKKNLPNLCQSMFTFLNSFSFITILFPFNFIHTFVSVCSEILHSQRLSLNLDES
jgi:hypothetical protein